MNYQCVIFDWDGTLMDSTARIVDCMGRAAADLELEPLSERTRQRIIGLGLPEAIGVLYPHLDSAGVERMRARYAHHFVAAEAVPCSLFPGVLPTLEALANAGVHMAVATGKSRAGLDRVWRQVPVAHYFATSRCADESGSKPDPTMVNQILAELSVSPAQALVVGDTSFDLDMARRAGVDRVGVRYGAHDASELLAFSPLALLDSMDELLNIVGLDQPILLTETETP